MSKYNPHATAESAVFEAVERGVATLSYKLDFAKLKNRGIPLQMIRDEDGAITGVEFLSTGIGEDLFTDETLSFLIDRLGTIGAEAALDKATRLINSELILNILRDAMQ